MVASRARMPPPGGRLYQMILAAVLSTFIGFAWPAAADELVVVTLHQSRIINLPGDPSIEQCGTKTIVLSNPLIADITMLSNTNGNLLVAIIGKGYGATNLVAYDCKGVELAKKIIEVTAPEI
jgi:Flp pilus assembly secretin CpaC